MKTLALFTAATTVLSTSAWYGFSHEPAPAAPVETVVEQPGAPAVLSLPGMFEPEKRDALLAAAIEQF